MATDYVDFTYDSQRNVDLWCSYRFPDGGNPYFRCLSEGMSSFIFIMNAFIPPLINTYCKTKTFREVVKK